MGTPLANRAGGTIAGSKANVDDLMIMPILAQHPLNTSRTPEGTRPALLASQW